MKLNRSLVVSVLTLALALATVLAWPSSAKCEVAPDVVYTLLDGRQGTLRVLRGKVVLVSFWSMSAIPA